MKHKIVLEVQQWMAKHGIDWRHNGGYPSIFKNQARLSYVPTTAMVYRVVKNNKFLTVRIYVRYDGQSVTEMEETIAHIKLLHDIEEIVVLY